MTDMKGEILSVGLSISLDLVATRDHAVTPLVGWEAGRFLITRYPFVNGKPLNIRTDARCVIRFVKDGVAYGSKTEVLSLQFHPAPLLFLKYPEEIEIVTFRQHSRVKTNLQAQVFDSSKLAGRDAVIMDISETGCLLRIPADDGHVLKSSDEFYLTFKILNARIELECVVRNTRHVGEQLLHGVSFINTSPMDRENILSLIDLIRSRSDE